MEENRFNVLHHYLNQIDDADCMTRRRSLKGLTQYLEVLSLDARVQFTADHAIGLLIDRLIDPIEKCRDLSLALISLFVNECGTCDLAKSVLDITLAACLRFENEPAEELRLRCRRRV